MLVKFKAALGAVAVLFVATTASAGADLKDIKISLMSVVDVAPVYAAMEQGYFEEQGLRVEIVPSTGGAAAIPGLIGGSFHFAYGNIVSNVLAVDKGLDLVAIAPTVGVPQEDGINGIVVKPDSNIQSGADLEGKSLAVNTRNNIVWLMARAWIRATGGDPDKVTYREVPFPQMQDAVHGGQVDAAFLHAPFYALAIESGLVGAGQNPYIVVQPNIEVGQYSTTRTLIENDPETVNGFLAALAKGNAWYDEHIEEPEVLELISEFTGMAMKDAEELVLGRSLREFDLAEFEKTLSLMHEEDMLSDALTIDRVVYQPQ